MEGIVYKKNMNVGGNHVTCQNEKQKSTLPAHIWFDFFWLYTCIYARKPMYLTALYRWSPGKQIIVQSHSWIKQEIALCQSFFFIVV